MFFAKIIAVLVATADRRGEIAQLVEQWPEEPRVLGSIPSLATIITRV